MRSIYEICLWYESDIRFALVLSSHYIFLPVCSILRWCTHTVCLLVCFLRYDTLLNEFFFPSHSTNYSWSNFKLLVMRERAGKLLNKLCIIQLNYYRISNGLPPRIGRDNIFTPVESLVLKKIKCRKKSYGFIEPFSTILFSGVKPWPK